MVKRKGRFSSPSVRRQQRIEARSLNSDLPKIPTMRADDKPKKTKINQANSKIVNSKKNIVQKLNPKSSIKNLIKESQQRRKIQLRWMALILTTVFLMALVGAAVKIFYIDRQSVGNTSDKKNMANSKQTNSETESKSVKLKNDQRLGAIQLTLSGSSYSKDNIFQLNIPAYKQIYNQSCEASSLRMALEYRGVVTTDEDILAQMGYDGEPAKNVDGRRIWSDPHKQFVGSRDGDQTQFTGYGVFAEPVAAAAEKNGRTAVVQNDVQLNWIVQQVYAGNPVILWGVSIKIADATWQTANGESVTVPMRTHTRLVVGVKGDFNNPDGFYINDPATGHLVYWTAEDLKPDIAKGIKQAVAVY